VSHREFWVTERERERALSLGLKLAPALVVMESLLLSLGLPRCDCFVWVRGKERLNK
jgi:hypothetical protein